MTATLVARARASPCYTQPDFPHTQDFLMALKRGEITKDTLHKLPHKILQELAMAIINSSKDGYTYLGENYEFALNIIPAPEITPAPCLENLPEFDEPLPAWLDTLKCRHCGKEIVVIKCVSRRTLNGHLKLHFLTIECGEVYITSISSKEEVLQ